MVGVYSSLLQTCFLGQATQFFSMRTWSEVLHPQHEAVECCQHIAVSACLSACNYDGTEMTNVIERGCDVQRIPESWPIRTAQRRYPFRLDLVEWRNSKPSLRPARVVHLSTHCVPWGELTVHRQSPNHCKKSDTLAPGEVQTLPRCSRIKTCYENRKQPETVVGLHCLFESTTVVFDHSCGTRLAYLIWKIAGVSSGHT